MAIGGSSPVVPAETSLPREKNDLNAEHAAPARRSRREFIPGSDGFAAGGPNVVSDPFYSSRLMSTMYGRPSVSAARTLRSATSPPRRIKYSPLVGNFPIDRQSLSFLQYHLILKRGATGSENTSILFTRKPVARSLLLNGFVTFIISGIGICVHSGSQ